MKDFSYQFNSAKEPTVVLRECLNEWNGPLLSHGYSLTTQSDMGLTYLKKYRPWWLIFPILLTFPLGLLFLIYTQEAQITAIVNPEPEGGTALAVNGSGPKAVKEGFETMEI